jgi:hypothetical protein
LCLALAWGCAYRRHTTLLNPVPRAAESTQMPKDMYSLRVIGAEAPARKISGLPWDDDGTDPDPFIRLYVDNRLVWESEVAENQHRPQWGITLPRNIVVRSESRFRLELWDYDTPVSADPIGHIERTGLPTNALPDAQARVPLNTQAMVILLVSAPVAHQGVGLTVELRSDYLKVLQVEPYSPAARGGIVAGEHIVGIGAERVAHMGDDEASSALSLAVDRKHRLLVTDAEGRGEREVMLEGKLVWLVM